MQRNQLKAMMLSNRIAILDIGTNSFHFAVYEKFNQAITVIYHERKVFRLTTYDEQNAPHISDSQIHEAAQLILKYKSIAESYQTSLMICGTSSLRDAINTNQFQSHIKQKTDLDIIVLSGKQEAELIYKGILTENDSFQNSLLCLDIGGGSTEIIYAKNDIIEFSESLPLGAVRLTQKYFRDNIITPTAIQKCNKAIEEQLTIILIQSESVVASGGTVRTILSIINELEDSSSVSFSKENFAKAEKYIISKATSEERKQIPGIEEKRADVIPAGVLILSALIQKCAIQNITYSESSLKEGIATEILNNVENAYLPF